MTEKLEQSLLCLICQFLKELFSEPQIKFPCVKIISFAHFVIFKKVPKENVRDGQLCTILGRNTAERHE